MASWTFLEKVVVPSGAPTSVVLNSNGTWSQYDDLVILTSVRTTYDRSGTGFLDLHFKLNDSSSGYTTRHLVGNGAQTYSYGGGTGAFFNAYVVNDTGTTANTFGNGQIYLSNINSSTAKSFTADGVSENNSSTAEEADQVITAGTWTGTAAITKIEFFMQMASVNYGFAQNSSFTIYGVTRKQALGKPKAIGGNITYSNGYWYHTFTGSGTFSCQQPLVIDGIVVAGGGGGGTSENGNGYSGGGGGGAGGFLGIPTTTIDKGNYLIQIGAGGVGQGTGSAATNGQNSIAFSVTTLGGGRGAAGSNSTTAAAVGGSGGGGGRSTLNPNGGNPNGAAGTAGQGFAGGNTSGYDAGGGGGAGEAGNTDGQGHGGDGLPWNGNYYAGGGGGGTDSGAAGGLGGGGNGGDNAAGTAGTAGTGGGGGGGGRNVDAQVGANGGSGVVIVRYRAD